MLYVRLYQHVDWLSAHRIKGGFQSHRHVNDVFERSRKGNTSGYNCDNFHGVQARYRMGTGEVWDLNWSVASTGDAIYTKQMIHEAAVMPVTASFYSL